MNNSAQNLGVNDQIIATLQCGNQILATLRGCNFSNMADVINAIASMAGGFMGMAMLSVRNKTQGWRREISLVSMSSPMLSTMPSQSQSSLGGSMHSSAVQRRPVQQSLFPEFA